LGRALADVGRRLTGEVRVVVLHVDALAPPTSAEDRAAGDRGALSAPEDLAAAWQGGIGWLSDRPGLVSIAVVRGRATGAGLHLALACDLRVLADGTELAVWDAGAGPVPGLGVTAALVDLVGYPRALDLCLTGRRVDAAEALDLGLADRVAPRDRLDATVDDLADTVLAVPRDAVTETKALLRAAAGRNRRTHLATRATTEREALARSLASGPADAAG
jgi:enoyl-CoA hydratase/carnithine racemase